MTETARVAWKPCWRIIPSRFPPIQLFERIAHPADLEAIIALEEMTNPRLRDEIGDIQLVAPEERIAGPGTSVIMAAFTHLNPAGSRFSNGSYGVYYAGMTLDTAIRETAHHREAFMRATNQPRMELDQRVYLADLDAALHDIRGRGEEQAGLYDPDSYGVSQSFARGLREAGSSGVVYDSVRHEGGQCAAVFRPKALSNCRQEKHLCFVWDGARVSEVYEKVRL